MTSAMQAEFDTFWRCFPRRVAKLDAMKAYEKARKLASAAELLEGVERYRANKPAYADWCHASTWLNKGRWLDDYETPALAVPSVPFEQTEMHQQLYKNNARYRADYDAKQQAS